MPTQLIRCHTIKSVVDGTFYCIKIDILISTYMKATIGLFNNKILKRAQLATAWRHERTRRRPLHNKKTKREDAMSVN